MDDVSAVANSKRVARNARLPSFITAASLAEKLDWVPSLQRLFRQQVQSHPVHGWTLAEGDLYSSIYELLSLPSGLVIFESRVAVFDSKKRGLLKGLFDAGWRQLPPDSKFRPRSGSALMSAMIRQEAWDIASWMAWSQFEIAGLKSERDGAETLRDLVETHSELAARLGQYWIQEGWLRGPDDGAERSIDDAASDEGTASALLELHWREEISDLGRRLSEATIGEDLSHELHAAGERLSVLSRRWAESGAASLRPRRDAALVALADTLRATEPPLTVAGRSIDGFIEALSLALGIDEATRIGEVEAAVAELQHLTEDALAAANAEDNAKALQAREDSDAADEAYAAARGLRRKAAQTLATFVSTQVSGLLTEDQAQEEEDLSAPAANLSIAPIADPHVAKVGDESQTSFASGTSIPPAGDVAEPHRAVEVNLSNLAAEATEAETGELPLTQPDLAFAEPMQSPLLEVAVELPSEPLDTPIEAAVAQALIEKRYGLAYHLAAAAEEQGLRVGLAPPAVLEALAVGAAAGAARLIPAAGRYKTLQEEVLLAMDANSMPSTRLTVFAGALRLALFAPDSSGVEILGRANLGDYGAGLHELCQFVAMEIRGRGLNLTPADFAPATADDDRRASEEAARKTLLDFAATAPSRRLKFHRAITIWTDVFRQGPVAEAIAAVENKAKNANALARAAEAWVYEDTAEQRVDLLDVAHRSRKDRPLEAGVRLRLADWLRQTAQHLRHWVEAHEACERTRGEHVLEKVRELRHHLQAAQHDLVSVAGAH